MNQNNSLSKLDVAPLAMAHDFPYLVIEYFKEEYRAERPSDKTLHIQGNDWGNEKVEAIYDC